MRPFFVATATALSLLSSLASANSLTIVATGPTDLAAIGDTTTFLVVMQTSQPTTSATARLNVSGAARIVSGTNDLTGTGFIEGTPGFALRNDGWGFTPNQLGACGPYVGGIAGSKTCTYAGGAPMAGHIGGGSFLPTGPGTYTIGSYTLQAFSVGTTTISFSFLYSADNHSPTINEWLDAGGNATLGRPTTNSLVLTPEPTTAALIGLGLAGIVVRRRRL